MIERLFRYPEYKYDLYGAFEYKLRSRTYNSYLQDVGYLPERTLIIAIEDALEYLGITMEEFFSLAERWEALEKELFAARGDGQDFYESWKQEYAGSNICANIINQHGDKVNFSIIAGILKKELAPSGPWADFGCGTGSLSISLALEDILRGPVYLVDVENEVQDFVRFRLEKHGLSNLYVTDVKSFSDKGYFSGIYCIDVLEHLHDPAAVFREQIHPSLACSGLLYLKAPWRGQLTHLDEAPENFYREGGRKLLGRKYRKLFRVQPMDIAAVYRKVDS